MDNNDRNIRILLENIRLDSPSSNFNEKLLNKIKTQSLSTYKPLINKKVFQLIFAIFAIFVVIATFFSDLNSTKSSSLLNFEINAFISKIYNSLMVFYIPEWLFLSTLVIFILIISDIIIKKIMDSKIRRN